MTDAPSRGRAWERPALRDEGDRHRPVGWVELFFDLVFVVIIAILAQDLEHHVDAGGLAHFLLQFLAVFWAWNGFTYYTERFESRGLENRLFVFLAILAVAGLAIWGEDGLGHNYPGFALAYLLARAINIALWLRAAYHVPVFRRAGVSFAVGFAAATVLIGVSLGLDERLRLPLWGLALIVDISSPALTQRFQRNLPIISRDKFPERFGLFTMILLGETVTGVIRGVATSNAEEGVSPTTLFEASLGLAIGFGMWWLYYDFIARRPTKPIFATALLWVYLHIVAMAAIVVVGVAIGAAIAVTDAPNTPPTVLGFLFVALGVMLLSFGCLELTLDRAADEPTHPQLSPGLKMAAGIPLIVAGLLRPDVPTGLAFGLALLAMAIQAAYGASVYYRR